MTSGSERLEVIFIVGSPRSGTTLLGDILDCYPQIGRWYEPYFVLDRYFQYAPNDCRTVADATDEVKAYVSNAFETFRRKRNCQIVVDKTPRNSLRIPFLRQIFPQAKFIHMLRDGRDTTLSIHREWRKRENILESRKNFLQGIQVLKEFLDEHPFWEHKIAAFLFEIGNPTNILKGRSHLFYRLRRWNGRVGWGPQFEGWQSVIDQVSTLEFNAMQWAKCVEAVIEATPCLSPDNFLEVKYESLLAQPEEVLRQIVDFFGITASGDVDTHLAKLKRTNTGKWQTAFSTEEQQRIAPIINPLLEQFGYMKYPYNS